MNLLKCLKTRKPYIVDFFTDNYGVYEYFRIMKGSEAIPDWWKSIDHNLKLGERPSEKSNTVKRCPGIINTFGQSFVMPLWTEIDFAMDENYNWNAKVSDQITSIKSHDIEAQAKGYLDRNKYTHLKIETPWVAREKTGLKFVISPCSWSSELLLSEYFIPTAIRSFNISHGNNIHGFIKNKKQSIILSAGTPLIHIFPLTDKKVQINCHYDPEEVNKIKECQPVKLSFSSSYYKKYKLMR